MSLSQPANHRDEEFEPSTQEQPVPGSTSRAADDLRECWARLQAIRQMVDVYQATIEGRRITGSLWFLALLLVGSLFPVALGAITGHGIVLGVGIASAVLGVVTLIVAAVTHVRFETVRMQARQQLELTRREAEGRLLQSATEAGVDPANAERMAQRLQQDQDAALADRSGAL